MLAEGAQNIKHLNVSNCDLSRDHLEAIMERVSPTTELQILEIDDEEAFTSEEIVRKQEILELRLSKNSNDEPLTMKFF